MDKNILTVDKSVEPDEGVRFLRHLGLTTSCKIVDQVLEIIQGEHDKFPSLYAVYKGTRLASGEQLPSICGKGTAYKIKKLYEEGQFTPYLRWVKGEDSEIEFGNVTRLADEDVGPIEGTGTIEETGAIEGEDSELESGNVTRRADEDARAIEEEDEGLGVPARSWSDHSSLAIKTPVSTYKRWAPTIFGLASSYWWLANVLLENQSERAITVGEICLIISRDDVDHVLHHLGYDIYGSRAEIPMPGDTLAQYLTIPPEQPVLIGALRFIDDSPFDPGFVDVALTISGTGRYRGQEWRHEMGRFELI